MLWYVHAMYLVFKITILRPQLFIFYLLLGVICVYVCVCVMCNMYVCVCSVLCMCRYMHQGVYLEIRGQLCGVGSFFMPLYSF